MRKGSKMSEESKRKLSELHRKENLSINTRKKISKALKGKNNGRYGKIVSNETRKKISEANKGKKRSEEQIRKRSEFSKGKNNPHFGKQHTKETKIRISKARSGKLKGKNNHRWLGGISKLPYDFNFDKELKALIHGRDNHRCICGAPSQVVHHIDYYKMNSNLDNLIALCNSCHSKTNSDRKRWIRFFENKPF